MLGLFREKNWWLGLLLVFVVGLAGVAFMGVRTYRDAPPIPDWVGPDGGVVVARKDVLAGQAVFQRHALMEYGSFFGDGASRGPDYTATALHEVFLALRDERRRELGPNASELSLAGVDAAVRRELKTNTYRPETNTVPISAARAAAFERLVARTRTLLGAGSPESAKPATLVSDEREVRALGAFFFWGAWVCSTERPGQKTSYTHDWPFDEAAGNVAGPSVLFWSVMGALGLMVGLALVLYQHGRFQEGAGFVPGKETPVLTADAVAAFRPTPVQRATFKFFVLAVVLFAVQVVAGILTVHDFVGLTTFFGLDVQKALPITIVRSWHVQLSVLWIATCWIGASIFVVPFLVRPEPAGQLRLVNGLFVALVVLAAGSFAGILLGPKGLLGEHWRLLGHQGWEFVELGRLWQGLLFLGMALWAAILFRGAWPAIRAAEPWTLPNLLLCSVVAILLFFSAGFVAGPETNFVIADFWRWCVIHMWAEAFFEVFTTIVVAWFMVLMGLSSRAGAARVVYLATLLFLGSGLLGISHNFYWNAKPVITLAVGSVFSTLQVVPLLLLALEAWRFRALPRRAAPGTFGQPEAFLFLLGVNFWNVLGAGVFGFIINLPIVNYYEHGTYLTVNHGHAALMGVYGNLSLAGVVFVARWLVAPERWSGTLVRAVFWATNLGLALMVALDLFPAGVIHLDAVLEKGLWWARSQAFIEGDAFQTLTWMRIIGGALFTLGGVIPLVVFVLTRLRDLKPADEGGSLPALEREPALEPEHLPVS